MCISGITEPRAVFVTWKHLSKLSVSTGSMASPQTGEREAGGEGDGSTVKSALYPPRGPKSGSHPRSSQTPVTRGSDVHINEK